MAKKAALPGPASSCSRRRNGLVIQGPEWLNVNRVTMTEIRKLKAQFAKGGEHGDQGRPAVGNIRPTPTESPLAPAGTGPAQH